VALLIAAAAIVTATVLATSEGGRPVPGAHDASSGADAPDRLERREDRPAGERTPATTPPDREYAPTENVSRDKSVSFPTDI
jgi:hypothetical protein